MIRNSFGLRALDWKVLEGRIDIVRGRGAAQPPTLVSRWVKETRKEEEGKAPKHSLGEETLEMRPRREKKPETKAWSEQKVCRFSSFLGFYIGRLLML
jgi:hypothetical protein